MSGRIRTIKPEWLEDELLASEADHVRMLSVGLILMADDHGRGRAAVAFVAGEVWRYDRSPEVLTKAREGLRRLSAVRFVRLYEVDGQQYFEIRSWSKHQKVQHVGKGRVPAPPEEKASEVAAVETPRETLTNPHETLTQVTESLTPDLRPHISDLIPDHEVIPETTVPVVRSPGSKAKGSGKATKAERAPAPDDPEAPSWLAAHGLPSIDDPKHGRQIRKMLTWSATSPKGAKLKWPLVWAQQWRDEDAGPARASPYAKPVQPGLYDSNGAYVPTGKPPTPVTDEAYPDDAF